MSRHAIFYQENWQASLWNFMRSKSHSIMWNMITFVKGNQGLLGIFLFNIFHIFVFPLLVFWLYLFTNVKVIMYFDLFNILYKIKSK